MKKGQVLEGIVERVVFPNKGIVSVRRRTEGHCKKCNRRTKDPFFH